MILFYKDLRRRVFFLFQKIIAIVSSSSILSEIYYSIFSRRFCREHISVLSGKSAYYKDLENPSDNYLLRRNVHRLEKGIIMMPRKEFFASDYIVETVEYFIRVWRDRSDITDELRWARDVISEYFHVVGDHDSILQLRCRFFEAIDEDAVAEEKTRMTPYARGDSPVANISYGELLALFRKRRSVRWYECKKVSMDVLGQAVDAASLAPSACNRQPFKFYVTLNPKRAGALAKLALGTAGFADNIQAMVVLVGDLSAYFHERDRHVIYIDGALFAMQFMLACETLGLSTCPINWPDIDESEMRMKEELGLKSYQRPIMLLSVGYALKDGCIPFSQKKKFSDLVVEIV